MKEAGSRPFDSAQEPLQEEGRRKKEAGSRKQEAGNPPFKEWDKNECKITTV
ncbi:MAG: hypothetical protein P2A85_05795 [Microcoleus anatoxicus]|uniref:hypothetical protein n=1 Tax=Microcoleus anatoxicus TaxID=2705319 RepID=UPI00366B668D